MESAVKLVCALLLWISVVSAKKSATVTVSACSVDGARISIEKLLRNDMKVFPMTVGDYNVEVKVNYGEDRGTKMSLSYPNDTIAFVVIHRNEQKEMGDVPQVLGRIYNALKKAYKKHNCQYNLRLMEANTMNNATNLPFVHVQTAGHVSGAAYFYQRRLVITEPANWNGKVVFGTSINVDFGRATMFSGVIVFEGLRDSSFRACPPIDSLKTQQEIIRFLSEVNRII